MFNKRLKARIAYLENAVEILQSQVNQPAYRQFIRNKEFTCAWYSGENLPYTITEYSTYELIDAFLKHTGMTLSKEITPEKKEVKFTKIPK
jgi:hypothetical protein